jgi:hypothetical protein
MSFYYDAVKYDLTNRGYNPEEWDISMVLLPVSTYYGHDVGCLFPTANISKIDIMSGKQNGMLKPLGFSRFSPKGEVQAFLDGGLFNKCLEIGMIHSNAKEYVREGWETIMKKLVSVGPSI